jgi:uncharacterized protein (DUF342 family)
MAAPDEDLFLPEDEDLHTVTSVAGAGGRRLEAKVLLFEENELRRVRVLTFHGYKAFLHYTRLLPHDADFEDIRACLKKAGVVRGIDDDALALLVELLNHGEEPVGPFQLAKGIPALDGEDGKIEFAIQPTSQEVRYDLDENGNVDFHRPNLIQNTLKGDTVAVIHPPTKGRAGVDIFGNEIPAVDGKRVTLRMGEGLRADQSLAKLFADRDGRVIFENGVLSISSRFEVLGNVDYSIGSVDFVGEVIVHGNVLDDFDVYGRKGVTIAGNVGSCQISSDGDVLLKGGVAGRGRGKISAGGAVSARYLNDVLVEADGDISVENEVVNSTLRAGGRLLIPRGSILGGEAVAFSGVEAGSLGSELGIATRISSGMDWRTEELIAELDKDIGEMEQRAREINESLDPLLRGELGTVAINKEQKAILQELLPLMRKLRGRIERAQEQRLKLHESRLRNCVNQINVNEMLHAGVMVRFAHLRANMKTVFRGPLSVVEDMEKDMVRVVTQFPLLRDAAPERPWVGGLADHGKG